MALTAKQIENSKMAYAIMAGIPDHRVNLNVFRRNRLDGRKLDEDMIQPECGSVACIAGWLSAHPYFKAQGLSYHVQDGHVSLPGKSVNQSAELLFGTFDMFHARQHNLGTSKREALERIRTHLFKHGAISPRRNLELSYEEMNS